MKTEARDLFERILPVIAVLIVFLLGAFALSPFGPALLWSVFVSVALYPMHLWLTEKLGKRRLVATLLMVIGLVGVVLVPMLFLLRSIIAVIPELAIVLVEDGKLSQFGLDLPANMPATWHELWDGLRDDFNTIKQVIGDDLRLLLSSVMLEGRLIGHFVLEFLLGLILAAVILQNAEVLERRAAKAAVKLGGGRGLQLAERSVLTIRYTVLGILGSSAVQTAIATFAYWVVGISNWPLLAFATFLLGLLQVGPVLIWGPLALWLYLDEQTGMAIFLTLWGLFAVGLSDNFVKALVVSRGANLPTTLVFLGAFVGLLIWGVVGIFLGPVILALCLELVLWWLEDEGDVTAAR